MLLNIKRTFANLPLTAEAVSIPELLEPASAVGLQPYNNSNSS